MLPGYGRLIVLRSQCWRRVRTPPPECFASALGAVRTKKWKPFHSMYRANYIRKLRETQAEEARLAAERAKEEGISPIAAAAVAADEPRVATTPFQATRLMRAFDIFPEAGAKVEFWTRLNVDLSRESVRGTCHLPNGLQTSVKVLAFCPDDEVDEMLKAGADVAGITEPVRRINQGWLGFDRCVATPIIMPQVMKVAKILGPRKMMPNPKSGTVVQNLKQAIKDAKGGTLLEFRAEGDGELKATIADAAFSDAKVLENLKFFVQTLLRARPRGSGGSGAAGGKTPAAGLIPTPTSQKVGDEAKDAYFLDVAMRLGSKGPLVQIDPESIMPASVGYFR
mmetsp:Transcript_107521/g.302641  ORF Transcript_107521/g.302641 Transcript_107521/m.302641 type:complete len:338 (-) Transcript_107521:97-1110(-)